MDHFRRVNDSHGRPVGDLVLKAMADICRTQLRDSDLMGRLGGAGFAVQMPHTSLGVTTIRAEVSSVSLFKRADDASQAARQGGHNEVAAAAPTVVLAA